MQPVEVMIIVIEEVQLFLLANTDKEGSLTEPNIMTYTLIEITKSSGMYAKGVEKWQNRPTQDRRKWAEFLSHMIEDYKGKLTYI